MAKNELPEYFFTKIQEIFRKTPILLIGSGFSCSYGLPSMRDLASHLINNINDTNLTNSAQTTWTQSIDAIRENLETGLNSIPIGTDGWAEILSAIRSETSKLILETTKRAEENILSEKKELQAPSRLLKYLFSGSPQNSESIHVITTNYDTLIELFCDLAELPLDTGFVGFRRRKPRNHPLFHTQYERVLVTEKRQQHVHHRPCKTVRLYKPHGSISWLITDDGPIEVLNDISVAERAIIVPGPSKYQDSLINTLFDTIRTEMNQVLMQAQALLCIGFGFNDDHLQGVIKQRLTAGMPTIIITRTPTPSINHLLKEFPHIVALFKDDGGSICHLDGKQFHVSEHLWKLDDFLKKFLE